MSTDIYAVIDYDEVFERDDGNALTYVESLAGRYHLGNDSFLGPLLGSRGRGSNGLPAQLSVEVIRALTLPVVGDLPRDVAWEPTVSAEKAAEWVAEPGAARWLQAQRAWDGELVEADEPSHLVAHPDLYGRATHWTRDELIELQERYRREVAEEGIEVALRPGDPLPERVVGCAGEDEEGRTVLTVLTELGRPSPALAQAIDLMAYVEAMLTEAPARLIVWFSS